MYNFSDIPDGPLQDLCQDLEPRDITQAMATSKGMRERFFKLHKDFWEKKIVNEFKAWGISQEILEQVKKDYGKKPAFPLPINFAAVYGNLQRSLEKLSAAELTTRYGSFHPELLIRSCFDMESVVDSLRPKERFQWFFFSLLTGRFTAAKQLMDSYIPNDFLLNQVVRFGNLDLVESTITFLQAQTQHPSLLEGIFDLEKLKNAKSLVQRTIYPDVIESTTKTKEEIESPICIDNSLFRQALRSGHLEVVEWVNKQLDAPDYFNEKNFEAAVFSGNSDVLNWLFNRCSEGGHSLFEIQELLRSTQENTFLSELQQFKNLAFVKTMVELFGNHEWSASLKCSILQMSLHAGNMAVIDWLLTPTSEGGVGLSLSDLQSPQEDDVNLLPSDLCSPLNCIIGSGHVEMTKALVQRPDWQWEKSPSMCNIQSALLSHSAKMVQWVLEQAPDKSTPKGIELFKSALHSCITMKGGFGLEIIHYLREQTLINLPPLNTQMLLHFLQDGRHGVNLPTVQWVRKMNRALNVTQATFGAVAESGNWEFVDWCLKEFPELKITRGILSAGVQSQHLTMVQFFLEHLVTSELKEVKDTKKQLTILKELLQILHSQGVPLTEVCVPSSVFQRVGKLILETDPQRAAQCDAVGVSQATGYTPFC